MDTEAAQPEQGQGAEESDGNELYSPFLEGIPTELHEQVIPALKAQDAEFTKRFQSRAEQIKPLEEAGLLDADPEQLAGYNQLDQVIRAAVQGDEQAVEAMESWWEELGESLGFFEDGEGEAGEAELDEDFDPYDPQSIQKLVQSSIQQQVEPIAQFLEQKELTEQQQREMQAANEQIEAQIAELKENDPSLTDEVIDEIVDLAVLFADESDNPIQAGYEKYQSLVKKGEAGLFQSKANQPSVPGGSGQPANAAVTPTMANVKELVKERLAQQKSL